MVLKDKTVEKLPIKFALIVGELGIILKFAMANMGTRQDIHGIQGDRASTIASLEPPLLTTLLLKRTLQKMNERGKLLDPVCGSLQTNTTTC